MLKNPSNPLHSPFPASLTPARSGEPHRREGWDFHYLEHAWLPLLVSYGGPGRAVRLFEEDGQGGRDRVIGRHGSWPSGESFVNRDEAGQGKARDPGGWALGAG